MMHHGRRSERGAGTFEYVAMVAIAAIVILGVVVVSTTTGSRLYNAMATHVCAALEIGNCPTLEVGDEDVPLTNPYIDQIQSGRAVFLGDSFSSGEGAGDYEDGTDTDDNACHRSSSAYSQIISDTYTFAGGSGFYACSGAETPDFENENDKNEGEAPQLDMLDEDVSFVAYSLGGNDVGFGDVLKQCIVRTCQLNEMKDLFYYEGEFIWTSYWDMRVRRAEDDLRRVYEETRTRAPNAEVYIMGYPPLFAEGTDGSSWFGSGDEAWMNEKAAELNSRLEELAESYGFTYVDPTEEFAGHGVGSDDPYINDMVRPDWYSLPTSESMHPNAKGQEAYARALQRAIEENAR